MKVSIKAVMIIVAVSTICACSLMRTKISLGHHVVSDWGENSCLLSRLTERSRVLEFHPGHGKPYTVSFEIQGESAAHCDEHLKTIEVYWKQLQIDELPDMGESKIGLAGKARIVVDKQELCQRDDFILAKSDGWYEVNALSIVDFRPPENPQSPVVASKEAFRKFIKKFTDFMNQECL